MPKRTKKNRYMKKGGDIITQAPPTTTQSPPSAFSTWFSGALNDAKKAATSAANSVSNAATSAANSVSNAATSAPTAAQPTVSPPQSTIGGKRRKKGGQMLALIGSPIQTAKPQVWVGGKTRKRTCNKRHKHTKSCKSQTYKKGNRKKRSRKLKFPFSKSLNRLIKM